MTSAAGGLPNERAEAVKKHEGALAAYTRARRERNDLVAALVQADMAVLLARKFLDNARTDLRAADPDGAAPPATPALLGSDDAYVVTGVWLPTLLKQVSNKLDLPSKTIADAAATSSNKTEEA
jgi:hypothetical protein